jgi:Zn-dependent peptidase ImmA (M78 family)
MSRRRQSRYYYRSKTRSSLKGIARLVLERFGGKQEGYAVEIEAIVERLGFDIVYRDMRGLPIEGYIARKARTIVINQYFLLPITRFRFTLAEELSHHILEFQLWTRPNLRLPRGARVHELTSKQYGAIEWDAKRLAAEILQPEDNYRECFAAHREKLQHSGVEGDELLRSTISAVAADFQVSPRSAGYRAKVLGYISQKKFDGLFPILF